MRSTRRCGVCLTFAMAMVLNGATLANAQTLASAPPPAPQPSHPFSALFADTVTDFRHLPSRDVVTVLAIGAVVAAAAHGVDRPATSALSGSGSLDEFFEAGETVGSARFQLGGAILTYAVGRATGHGRVAAIGADLIRANVVAQALTGAVKLSTRRDRPDATQFSFPSGHTSVSFATATVLQRHLGWRAGVPAYAVASYVAASRIHDKRHFLSDVAFGAAIGLVAGRTVTIGRGKAAFALAPVATAGGGGIGLTWVGR